MYFIQGERREPIGPTAAASNDPSHSEEVKPDSSVHKEDADDVRRYKPSYSGYFVRDGHAEEDVEADSKEKAKGAGLEVRTQPAPTSMYDVEEPTASPTGKPEGEAPDSSAGGHVRRRGEGFEDEGDYMSMAWITEKKGDRAKRRRIAAAGAAAPSGSPAGSNAPSTVSSAGGELEPIIPQSEKASEIYQSILASTQSQTAAASAAYASATAMPFPMVGDPFGTAATFMMPYGALGAGSPSPLVSGLPLPAPAPAPSSTVFLLPPPPTAPVTIVEQEVAKPVVEVPSVVFTPVVAPGDGNERAPIGPTMPDGWRDTDVPVKVDSAVDNSPSNRNHTSSTAETVTVEPAVGPSSSSARDNVLVSNTEFVLVQSREEDQIAQTQASAPPAVPVPTVPSWNMAEARPQDVSTPDVKPSPTGAVNESLGSPSAVASSFNAVSNLVQNAVSAAVPSPVATPSGVPMVVESSSALLSPSSSVPATLSVPAVATPNPIAVPTTATSSTAGSVTPAPVSVPVPQPIPMAPAAASVTIPPFLPSLPGYPLALPQMPAAPTIEQQQQAATMAAYQQQQQYYMQQYYMQYYQQYYQQMYAAAPAADPRAMDPAMRRFYGMDDK